MSRETILVWVEESLNYILYETVSINLSIIFGNPCKILFSSKAISVESWVVVYFPSSRFSNSIYVHVLLLLWASSGRIIPTGSWTGSWDMRLIYGQCIWDQHSLVAELQLL